MKRYYPEYEDFQKFLDQKICTLEALQMSKHNFSKNLRGNNSISSNTKVRESDEIHSSRTSNEFTNKCLFCKGNHFLSQCQTFQKNSLDKRREVAREHQLCFKCLKTNHRIRE